MPPRTHTNFERAFTPGHSGEAEGFHFEVQVVPAGELALSAGCALVAFDPAWPEGAVTVARALPIGTGAVHLSRVRFADRDAHTAAARVVLSDAPVVDWAEVDALGVDTGTAALGVPEVLGDEDAMASLSRNALPDNFVFALATGRTAVVFETGIGDGIYACFVGLDANRAVAQVALDFGLLLTPEMCTIDLGPLELLPPGPIALPRLAQLGIQLTRERDRKIGIIGNPQLERDAFLTVDATGRLSDDVGDFALYAIAPDGRSAWLEFDDEGWVRRFGVPEGPVVGLRLVFRSGIRQL